MNEEFLPQDYEVPEKSNYMNPQDGDNPFRILSSAIVGYKYWTDDSRPVRLKKEPEALPKDLGVGFDGGPGKIDHFWAFVVWNYNAKRIQVYEVTQSSIQGEIMSLVNNPTWGDPKKYDIVIKKRGQKKDTRYTVMPNPHSDLPEGVLEKYESMNINLDALYYGDDPFGGEEEQEEQEEINK